MCTQAAPLLKAMVLVAAISVIAGGAAPAAAQISVTHEFLPAQNLADPAAGQNNAKIESKAFSVNVAFPVALKNGRTVLINELFYQRRDFSYKGFAGGNPVIGNIHDLNYTLSIQHGFSEKWALLASVTPGLASDFNASLSGGDFNFQAVTAFIRTKSPRFSYGFGAVYSTQFGQPIPLPVIALNWNNGGKLRWDTILPVSSEFWYTASQKLNLGLLFGLNGNTYNTDSRLFAVPDPQLRYFTLTLGPSIGYRLSSILRVKVEGGLVGVQQYQLYSGNTKQSSLNLKPSSFVRIGLSLGG
ncbi:MAG: hypothetical protein HOH43_00090 [Candidatus Latescibacteria bacterium]|jgi:hypothetical protein|nr:hypothetical protein [Candidatus Latescibacterota bacterium]